MTQTGTYGGDNANGKAMIHSMTYLDESLPTTNHSTLHRIHIGASVTPKIYRALIRIDLPPPPTGTGDIIDLSISMFPLQRSAANDPIIGIYKLHIKPQFVDCTWNKIHQDGSIDWPNIEGAATAPGALGDFEDGTNYGYGDGVLAFKFCDVSAKETVYSTFEMKPWVDDEAPEWGESLYFLFKDINEAANYFQYFVTHNSIDSDVVLGISNRSGGGSDVFVSGDTITGAPSTAFGTYAMDNDTDDLLVISGVTGTFTTADSLSSDISGTTADVDSVDSDLRPYVTITHVDSAPEPISDFAVSAHPDIAASDDYDDGDDDATKFTYTVPWFKINEGGNHDFEDDVVRMFIRKQVNTNPTTGDAGAICYVAYGGKTAQQYIDDISITNCYETDSSGDPYTPPANYDWRYSLFIEDSNNTGANATYCGSVSIKRPTGPSGHVAQTYSGGSWSNDPTPETFERFRANITLGTHFSLITKLKYDFNDGTGESAWLGTEDETITRNPGGNDTTAREHVFVTENNDSATSECYVWGMNDEGFSGDRNIITCNVTQPNLDANLFVTPRNALKRRPIVLTLTDSMLKDSSYTISQFDYQYSIAGAQNSDVSIIKDGIDNSVFPPAGDKVKVAIQTAGEGGTNAIEVIGVDTAGVLVEESITANNDGSTFVSSTNTYQKILYLIGKTMFQAVADNYFEVRTDTAGDKIADVYCTLESNDVTTNATVTLYATDADTGFTVQGQVTPSTGSAQTDSTTIETNDPQILDLDTAFDDVAITNISLRRQPNASTGTIAGTGVPTPPVYAHYGSMFFDVSFDMDDVTDFTDEYKKLGLGYYDWCETTIQGEDYVLWPITGLPGAFVPGTVKQFRWTARFVGREKLTWFDAA